MLIMKKIYIFFLILFLIVCQSTLRQNTICEISFEEFEEKVVNRQSFIVVIGRNDCINCVNLENLIKNTDKDSEVDIVFLKYSSEERNIFLEQISQYFTNIEIIPYYAYIQEGKILKTGQGYSEEGEFFDFLNKISTNINNT